MGSACRFRDWACLPGELLHIVLNKLGSNREYISFCLVCKPWLSVVREHEEKEVLSLRHLLLMTVPYLDPEIHIWLLHNFMNRRNYRLWLTSSDYKSFCGSSYGWFAFVDPDNNLVLMNPFSRRTIPLPPLQFEFGSTIFKVVLSNNPDSAPLDDCLVVAIYGERRTLAFTKLGSDSWTYVDRSLKLFNDVMFDGDRLLAIDLHARLISFNPFFGLPRIDAAKVDVIVPRCMGVIRDAYIVRSCRSGAVLMVRRSRDKWATEDVRIFKLVEFDKRFEWEEIKRLEDETLFVGFNHSVSVSCLGILSAVPNRVCIIGHVVNGIKNFSFKNTGERLPKPPGTYPPWVGRAVSPPKLEKLFCVGDDI